MAKRVDWHRKKESRQLNGYASPIPRKRMKELMKRKGRSGDWDTILWFGLLIILGIIANKSWGTWWAVPAFAAYGGVYALTGNSRWHEASHGTMFKTGWMKLRCSLSDCPFMNLFPATPWKWSHAPWSHGYLYRWPDADSRPETSVGKCWQRIIFMP